MRKRQTAIKLTESVELLGGYEAAGRVCGVSGKAVKKWVIAGKLPRTEATGETRYAQLMSEKDPRIDPETLLATVISRVA